MDFMIESVAIELSRVKNREYKQPVIAIKSSLYAFLYQNNLLTKNPFHEDGTMKEDFVIMLSDLKERRKYKSEMLIPLTKPSDTA